MLQHTKKLLYCNMHAAFDTILLASTRLVRTVTGAVPVK